MTTPPDSRAVVLPSEAGLRPARRPRLSRSVGYLFIAPYLLFVALFGVGPAVYAVVLSVSTPAGGFAGIANFTRVMDDFRFLPAVVHVALFVALWLVSLLGRPSCGC